MLSSRLDRQKSLCTELSNTLRSLSLSSDIRQAELSKLRNELNVSRESNPLLSCLAFVNSLIIGCGHNLR